MPARPDYQQVIGCYGVDEDGCSGPLDDLAADIEVRGRRYELVGCALEQFLIRAMQIADIDAHRTHVVAIRPTDIAVRLDVNDPQGSFA